MHNAIHLWDSKTGNLLRTLNWHVKPVISIAFSPNGRILASGSQDGTIAVWDVRTGEHTRTLAAHVHAVEGVGFSPDGTIFASMSRNGAKLWNTAAWSEIHTLDNDVHEIGNVAFSPNGKTIMMATSDWEVRIWDTKTGETLRSLPGHRSGISGVAFFPDGRTLVSCSYDGTVLLWELAPSRDMDRIDGDVNGDRLVNLADLIRVVEGIGDTGERDTDIDGDRVVNFYDVLQVAGKIGDAGIEASKDTLVTLGISASDVEGWLKQAQELDLTDPSAQRGVRFLEQLLAAFVPKRTVLLQNYPNPFNPETWIPYHLADGAEVEIAIHDVRGALVRRLTLEYQDAGYYVGRERAAYWDGRNDSGEAVANGDYFYRLRAGDFAASRRMVIVK